VWAVRVEGVQYYLRRCLEVSRAVGHWPKEVGGLTDVANPVQMSNIGPSPQ